MGVSINMNKLYKNNVRLNDIQGVNRLLGRVANALVQDEITEEKARAIGYICNILYKSLQVGELEDRLQALEIAIEGDKVRGVS